MPTDEQFLDGLDVRPFGPDINIATFECDEYLDWFLANAAAKCVQQRLDVLTCWMDGDNLAGYMATAMSELILKESSDRHFLGLVLKMHATAKDLERFGALLIGMLGVCKRYQGRGLGLRMANVAKGQAATLSKSVGCRFVIVDSEKTKEAIGLYTKAGFREVSGSDPKRKTIRMYYDLKPVP